MKIYTFLISEEEHSLVHQVFVYSGICRIEKKKHL